MGDSARSSNSLAYAFMMWLKHKTLVGCIDVVNL